MHVFFEMRKCFYFYLMLYETVDRIALSLMWKVFGCHYFIVLEQANFV